MSAQYRDNLNNRSLYSNATTRQNCVSCPSSCSCNLGARSTMDQLMFRAWSKGPDGDPSVFHQSSNACPSCGRVEGSRRESYEDLQVHRTQASSAGETGPILPCLGSDHKCTMPTEAEPVPSICEDMRNEADCNELVITSPGGWAHKCYWARGVCTTGAICKPSGEQVKAACPGTWTGLPNCNVQDDYVFCAHPSDGANMAWQCDGDFDGSPPAAAAPGGMVITSPDGWGYMCENTRTRWPPGGGGGGGAPGNLQCHPKPDQVNAACGVPTTYTCDDSGECSSVAGPGGTSLAVCEQTPFVPGSCSCQGTPSNMYEDDCKNARCTWTADKTKQHCGTFGPY